VITDFVVLFLPALNGASGFRQSEAITLLTANNIKLTSAFFITCLSVPFKMV
jgi:hypothetical protein